MDRSTKLHIRELGVSALLGLPLGATITSASFDATSRVISIELTGGGLDSPEEGQSLTQRFRDVVNKDGRYVGRLAVWSAEPKRDALEEAISNAQMSQKDFLQKREDEGLPISAMVAFDGNSVPVDALGALMGKAMAIPASKDESINWVFLPPRATGVLMGKGYVGFTWSQRFKDE